MQTMYHGYHIKNENGRHVARPVDGDDLSIISTDLPRLRNAIDHLWVALNDTLTNRAAVDRLVAPRWLKDWLADPSAGPIDIDRAYSRGAC